jgi:N-acetylmuramoyl-L-alanine amidase
MEDFAKKLVEISQYPKLNAIILAQAMLETGRFTSPLAKEHFCFFGTKWRPEMEGLATPVTVPVTSEASGFGTFCHFPTIENGVKGYFKFITRAPYKGWEEFKEDDAGYIRFIAKCGWAADHNYADKVLMLLPEAEKLLKSFLPQPTPATYWAELYPKTGNLYLIEEPGSKAIKVWETRRETARLAQALTEVRVLAGMVAFAPADKGEPALEDPLPQPEKPKPNGIKIALDAGHSSRHVGARSNNEKVFEEKLNLVQTDIITKRLEAKGFTVAFWDPIDDNIYAIGKAAKGSDMFISCHHNSYDNGTEDPYVACMTHASKRNSNDNKFASLVSKKIAAALNHKLFQASGELPGVYPAALSVLSGAADVGVPVKVLVESYFLNPYKDMATATARSTKAAHAIADAVIEWFKA